MKDNKWARLLTYVTGLVNQKLLLQNEYLIAENRILRARPWSCLLLLAEADVHLAGDTVITHAFDVLLREVDLRA